MEKMPKKTHKRYKTLQAPGLIWVAAPLIIRMQMYPVGKFSEKTKRTETPRPANHGIIFLTLPAGRLSAV